MSAQPSKRRKTSPIAATPVFNRNDAPASASRASYMSPTRASLSRFNPSLLPTAVRAASAGPASKARNSIATPQQNAQATPNQLLARGQEAFNYIMGNFNAQMQQTMMALSAKNSPLALNAGANSPMVTTPSIFGPGSRFPTVETPHGAETDQEMEAMRAAIRVRKEQERVGRAGSVGSRATPLSVRRVAASVPREGVENEDEDELSIEIGRNELEVPQAIRSRATSVRSPQSAVKPMAEIVSMPSAGSEEIEIDPAIEEELEIDELSPDAPKQQPVPRSRTQKLVSEERDDLPDTPEAIRRQLEAEDHPRRGVLFSSPSKRKKSQGTPKKNRRRSDDQPTVRPSDAASPQQDAEEPVVENQPRDAGVLPEKRVSPPPRAPDPLILAKREEKAQLERELRALQDEIKQFEHIARVFTNNEDEATDREVQSAIKILTANTEKQAKQPEASLSSLLTSFLPFSIPTAPAAVTTETGIEEEFVSHVPLKEDDPLPLNSLFTPLSLTSTAHVPTVVANSDEIRQKHSLTLTSPGSLLSCSLDMTVASSPGIESAPSIHSLKLMDLSPRARTEIGDWITQRCAEGDVAGVGYVLGRYWDICVKRARCWIEIGKHFPILVDGRDQAEDDIEIVALNNGLRIPKQFLLPHIGRSSLTLQDDNAILQVTWKLQCDWTGEVESVISAHATMPQSWHEADTSDALRKIPATFDVLMRERGVVKAVEVVGGLVFGA